MARLIPRFTHKYPRYESHVYIYIYKLDILYIVTYTYNLRKLSKKESKKFIDCYSIARQSFKRLVFRKLRTFKDALMDLENKILFPFTLSNNFRSKWSVTIKHHSISHFFFSSNNRIFKYLTRIQDYAILSLTSNYNLKTHTRMDQIVIQNEQGLKWRNL